jgi:putative ABC transport system permease protein
MAAYNRLGAHVSWMVRTSVEPYAAATAIREALHEATHLPLAEVRSMDDVSTSSTAGPRFEAWLMTLFGVAALLLAALGVYGVLAYAVQERTREIGIRVALGATAREIRGLVLARGLTLTAIGMAVGMVSALGLTRLLSGILFGISPRDGVSFAIVPVALCIAALAAIWLPARRAARVDPVIALRAE